MAKEQARGAYVSAEQLRVGLHIFVDLPWFRHPFMRNEFVIRSAEQIQELRALGKPRFRYDPERSEASPDTPAMEAPGFDAGQVADSTETDTGQAVDAPATDTGQAADASGTDSGQAAKASGTDTRQAAEASGTDTQAAPPAPESTPLTTPEAPELSAEPSAQTASGAKRSSPGADPSPARLLAEHRKRILHVEKSFLKSSVLLRNLNRSLLQRPAEALEDMKGLVDQMVLSFLEHPEATLHLIGERCGGEEVYCHVLNVSVLSMMLTRGLQFSHEQARVLGLGALLHDIGLMEIPDRILNKPADEYTKPERELRAMHCEFGVRIGKQVGLSPEVLEIIDQHHEMADGSGQPRGLRLEQMSLPARVVAMVNFYDNLCNPLDLSLAMTPHEALSFMFAKRRNKFDAGILQQMIRCLGVYPPGTIVMLSNDAFALVMSVNPAKPLRPWVMLHDPTVPKEKAPLINLEQETGINISKAIRPALLPPQVYTYLNPRKRVTYFFDSSVQPGRGGE